MHDLFLNYPPPPKKKKRERERKKTPHTQQQTNQQTNKKQKMNTKYLKFLKIGYSICGCTILVSSC